MIVEPDFPDHWKTQLLISLTGEPTAPMLLLRLWAFCQQRKTCHFTDLTNEALAAVCRWSKDPAALRKALAEARWIDQDTPTGAFTVHQWDEVNAALVRNWKNGAKGGRPISPGKPSHNPSLTDGLDKMDRSGLDGIGKDQSPKPPQAGGRGHKRTKPAKPGSVIPTEQPEPRRGRMLSLNAIFRRSPVDAWTVKEVEALEQSGLLTMAELDFVDACETVRVFYHATIPREIKGQYWKRSTLETLLHNWGGELDKGRAWTREHHDGVVKV